MELSKEDIDEINAKFYWDDNEQGIFNTPSGVKEEHVNKTVVYMCWVTGGKYGNDYNHHYDADLDPETRPNFRALDLVLEKLCPNITEKQRKEIEYITHESDVCDDQDYYFNYTNYDVEYIILDDLIKLLKTF